MTSNQPIPVSADDLLTRLQGLANPENVAGMARFGISAAGTLGVSVTTLRGIVKELRPWRRADPLAVHELAGRLWASGVHEARILAGLIDIPALVTETQADAWVADLDSWDLCDQLSGLFGATDFAYAKAVQWSAAEEVFVKRSGFVLMCSLAVHDKAAPDTELIGFLPLIEQAADDGRNFVKKAVNWALRQIGKRSPQCYVAAVASAEQIFASHADSAAFCCATQASLRDLCMGVVRTRLGLTTPDHPRRYV